MLASGIQPDAYTFNTLISIGARVENGISVARKWLGVMRSACLAPDERTYNAPLLQLAVQGLAVGVHTSSLLIKALLDVAAKHYDLPSAERWFQQLVAEAGDEACGAVAGSRHGALQGWQPSPVSWRTLVSASLACGDVSSAEKSLRAMAASKIQPDTASRFSFA